MKYINLCLENKDWNKLKKLKKQTKSESWEALIKKLARITNKDG